MASEKNDASKMNDDAKRVFEAEHVTHRFGEHRVLDDVSFVARAGEVLCVVGPNGGGKSTLVRIALGLIAPTSGRVIVRGGAVGYVPQRKVLPKGFPARAEELIVANLRGRWPWRIRANEREQALRTLEAVGGAGLYGKPLATLSGGELQRVFLARALVLEPKLLVLDEPETGVDTAGRRELVELLHRISCDASFAAILVTHHPEVVARMAHRVLYLDRSVVACGPPSELFGRAGLVSIGDPRLRSTRHDATDEATWTR